VSADLRPSQLTWTLNLPVDCYHTHADVNVLCSLYFVLMDSCVYVQVWDLFYNANSVRDMIKQKIQEESLRTYLFSYSSVYDSLSLDILSSMFELDKAVVHSIVSKMIINEELMVNECAVIQWLVFVHCLCYKSLIVSIVIISCLYTHICAVCIED